MIKVGISLKKGDCKFSGSVGYINKTMFYNRTKIIISKPLYADLKSKKNENNKISNTMTKTKFSIALRLSFTKFAKNKGKPLN